MFITARNPMSDRHLSDTMSCQQYINMNPPYRAQASFKNMLIGQMTVNQELNVEY